MSGIGVPAPIADLAKQAAVARAQQLLQHEKIAAAKASGKNADAASLAAERYTSRDVIVEADGSEHVRMDRTYRDLPVIGGGVVVHSRDGNLLSATRTLDLQVPDAAELGSPPKAALSQNQAVLAANKHFDAELLKEPIVKTVYYAKDNQPTLAYEVELLGSRADRMPVNKLIYIDANTGDYLAQDSKIFTLASATGSAFTLFRGKVEISTTPISAAGSPENKAGFVLVDSTRGGGKTLNGGNLPADKALIDAAEGHYDETGMVTQVDDSQLGKPFFDVDNAWGTDQIDLSQRVGAEVHYGVAKTWDYYKKQHDRSGIANDGKGVRAVANVSTYGGDGTNAFWSSGLNSMYYLNGVAGESNPVIALDVAGHEMSHGVNAATAKLIYEGDSGGLNEANSDIMGTLVEFYDNSSKDPPDYLIGESVNTDGTPLRYMFKPSLDAFDFFGLKIGSFDCYGDKPFGTGLLDDPHFTSGVGNHFFYLLSEGVKVPASHRKTLTKADLVCNGNTALAGITNKVAGQIWYRALTLYMVEQTNYPQAREATQQAAADLLDRGLLTKKQANAVACAWDAVHVSLPAGSAAATCT
ncbi:M4 family metallopeptidase [Lysobacter sp. TAB13]|uniref:M4 family metallopeptidase n=1 Tax=Lysobacter sp. TAB13 TaxID=3233065 RepID=UPI003F985C87